MQPQDRLNYEILIKKVHNRLKPEVLKAFSIEKKKRKINILTYFFLSNLFLTIMFILIQFNSNTLKNIFLLEFKYIAIIFLISLLIINRCFYIKWKRILRYEDDINNNSYYITQELGNYPNLIMIENLTNEEIQILLSLNTTDLEINLIISKMKEKNYFNYRDLYDIEEEEILDDIDHWGWVQDKKLNKSINIREDIFIKDKSLLLHFESLNNENTIAV